MTHWTPYLLREAALEKINALLAQSPDLIEERFSRACLLAELDRTEEAKIAFLDLLKRDPKHYGGLIYFGNMLYQKGFKSAARTLYLEAVKTQPNNPAGIVNLANAFLDINEIDNARQYFEIALHLDPENIEANRGMAYLLTDVREEAKASHYREKGFRQRPFQVLPYFGGGPPVTVLLLVSALGGMIPLRHHLDPRVFLVTVLFVEYFDLSMPLPLHQIIVNSIGDADLCGTALEITGNILKKTNAPVLNRPEKVLQTRRAQSGDLFSNIPGVIMPKMVSLSRKDLEKNDLDSLINLHGFSLPLLLRSPGFHAGRNFILAENVKDIKNLLPSLPGEELLMIQFLNVRSPDHKIRKYRVMMIGGKLYPLHLAISHNWKVHYFSAEMSDILENRTEEEAFLNNMPKILGPGAMETLEKICLRMGLDYGGVDFSLNPNGKIVLFEANATMVVNPLENDARWEYRRGAVQDILDAIGHMLTNVNYESQ